MGFSDNINMDHERKPVAFTVKAAIFAVGVFLWLGLAFLLHSQTEFFRKGGWGMWPILASAIVFLWITVERVIFLFTKASVDAPAFVSKVQRRLLAGDLGGAINACDSTGAPLARIVGAGLKNLEGSDTDVQDAIDEAALSQLPDIEKGTGYLAMIGNIATLLGLLGTIVGLIKSFAGVSLEDVTDLETQRRAATYVSLVPECKGFLGPDQGPELVACVGKNKAAILAEGISEAMHCTAFGLSVGILALLAFSALNGRTQRLLDEVSASSVHLVNLAAMHRRTIGLG